MLLIAIDVGQFGPPEEFHRRVAELLAHVKSSAVAPGFNEVLVPGEMEHRQRVARRQQGISIDAATWSELIKVSQELNVAPPDEVDQRGDAPRRTADTQDPSARSR